MHFIRSPLFLTCKHVARTNICYAGMLMAIICSKTGKLLLKRKIGGRDNSSSRKGERLWKGKGYLLPGEDLRGDKDNGTTPDTNVSLF